MITVYCVFRIARTSRESLWHGFSSTDDKVLLPFCKCGCDKDEDCESGGNVAHPAARCSYREAVIKFTCVK